MKILTVIYSISLCAILRTGFLIIMIIFISSGHLLQSLDFFEASEIELAEEKEIESEENEEKEEVEKDKIFDKMLSYEFIIHKKIGPIDNALLNWNLFHGDIPTPPPKIAIA